MEALAAKAVLDHPEKFGEAAKKFVEAQGESIKNVEKAIHTLETARSFISSTTTEHAIIINLSDVEHTWYTYNDIAPIKITT